MHQIHVTLLVKIFKKFWKYPVKFLKLNYKGLTLKLFRSKFRMPNKDLSIQTNFLKFGKPTESFSLSKLKLKSRLLNFHNEKEIKFTPSMFTVLTSVPNCQNGFLRALATFKLLFFN